MLEWTIKKKNGDQLKKHYNKSMRVKINKDESGFPYEIHPSGIK